MISQLVELVDRALAGAATAQRLLAFWGPVAAAPALLGPFLAIASVVSLALLTGVALGALATLMVALLVLYLLLTEVFGVSVTVTVP